MEYINLRATAAASTGRVRSVKYSSFVSGVRRELSVALRKGNHGVFRAGIHVYSTAS
jgi:hypothetical protein